MRKNKKEPKNLSEISENFTVQIVRYSIQDYASLKLAQIGMIPGEIVKVIRKSSIGGTILIELSNSVFCIRKTLAKNIIVQPFQS